MTVSPVPLILALFMKTLLSLSAASLTSIVFIGCASSPQSGASGERPGVVVPSGSSSGSNGTALSGGDSVLAEIDGVKLTDAQFKPILYKSGALDVLLMVIQREMAKAEAGKAGITISPADVEAEQKLTLAAAFTNAKEEDYDQALKQLLAQQHVSETEFGILMEYNAYLRALAKPVALANISEESVKAEFNSLYGERVEIRDIALNNLQEVAEAQRLLNHETNPVPFEEVARRMSRLPSSSNGGLLPPFARTSPGYNPVFTAAAFALEPGTVSTDPVQDKGFYHIIKVERRIEPTVVKYEDVKASVRESLVERRAATLMQARRLELAQHALRNLNILEPSMKAEFAARVAAANPKPAEKEKIVKELNAIEKEPPATEPTTAPSTDP